MNNSPYENKERKLLKFNNLINNNKFVLFLSFLIAMLIWVAVAMYASPQESYTVYNIPITINTENSLVAQKGYKNFWQSDEKIDVTVTGPRYLINTLTAEDILVNANLNAVDNAGVSELALKVSLKNDSQDITISSQSKTKVSVYFDSEMEKEVKINFDETMIAGRIPEGYQINSCVLTQSAAVVRGPATEIKKIKSIEAAPEETDEFIYKTTAIPVTLNLVGGNTTDTVSVNKYVSFAQDLQDCKVNVSLYKNVELKPVVKFTGTADGEVESKINVSTVLAKLDADYVDDFNVEEIVIKTIDYDELNSGETTFKVKASDVIMPEGLKFNDNTFEFVITVTLILPQPMELVLSFDEIP